MKSLLKALFINILFFPFIGSAQLAVVYDLDGYTNVRKNKSSHAKIIGKIVEGRVFALAYDQEIAQKKDQWIAVNLAPAEKLTGLHILKFAGKENNGFVHKSRIFLLDSLIVFEALEIDSDHVVHKYRDVEISIETQVFDPSKHTVRKAKEHGFLIDGLEAYPYYGGDAVEIQRISFWKANVVFDIPAISFRNLFMVDAQQTKVYAGEKGEYYIVFDAGDGADGYNIIYCIKDSAVFSMTVTSTLP